MKNPRVRRRPNIVVRFVVEIGRVLVSTVIGLVLIAAVLGAVILAASSPPARAAMDFAVDRAGADDEVFGLVLIGGVHALITLLVTGLLMFRGVATSAKATARAARRFRRKPVVPASPPASPPVEPQYALDLNADLPPWARPRTEETAA